MEEIEICIKSGKIIRFDSIILQRYPTNVLTHCIKLIGIEFSFRSLLGVFCVVGDVGG